MINKYQSFVEDSILENIINESIIYYSPDLRKIITKLSKTNTIAQDLLSVETTDIKPDITFVDLDKEGYLSFSTMRNAKKNITDKFPHIDYIDTTPDINIADELWSLDKRGSDRATGLYTKSRNQVGIGKFVNKIFPNKYNDKEREEFVNSFKATIENSGERFQIVVGEDIAHWYNYQNYKERAGTLGNSCMCEKPASFFDIYTQNPEICKMLILVEDDKLIGRAILWKVTNYRKLGRDFQGPEWFMDRQYTIKDSDIQKFRKYADEQGWGYKTNNNHHSFVSITWNGEVHNVTMKIQLKKKTYGRYPYMDTFRRLDPDTGILYNDDEEDNQGQYLLDDTSGGYTETRSGVYSEWEGETIPEDRAVWSDYVDSYLWDNRAVEVMRGSRRHRGWYPEDHDNIVYDEWIGEYLHIDDTVFSEKYGYSLLSDTAVEVIIGVDFDGDIETSWMHQDDTNIFEIPKRANWYGKLQKLNSSWSDYEYILSKLVRKKDDGDYILNKYKIEVYTIVGKKSKDNPIDLQGVEHLTKLDAEILGYDIEEGDWITTDQFDYHDTISEYTKLISDEIDKKLEEINSSADISQNQLELKRELIDRDSELQLFSE